MLCVFEYLPLGDLAKYLGKEEGREEGKPRTMSWNMHGRSVAEGVAQGLAFLHARKVCCVSRLQHKFLVCLTRLNGCGHCGLTPAVLPLAAEQRL